MINFALNKWDTEIYVVTSVERDEDAYIVETNHMQGYFLYDEDNKKHMVPKIGDDVQYKDINGCITGMKINGEIVFERSDMELILKDLKDTYEISKTNYDSYKEYMKENPDEQMKKLHPSIRDAILQYRSHGDMMEIYMFHCAMDSLKLLEHFHTVEEIEEFRRTGDHDLLETYGIKGHSGCSLLVVFSMAIKACRENAITKAV